MQIVVWVLSAWVATSIVLTLAIARYATRAEYWDSKRDKLTGQWMRQKEKDRRDRRLG